ncbi:MAG: hypothetical protein Q9176_006857 [Flavoplaca citrina]
MTITVEELEADGAIREELFEYWEAANKRMQPWKFDIPFKLTPKTLQQWWPLTDLHEFCLKTCAIYATVDIAFPQELAQYLWAKWFHPSITCRFGEFFAKFVASYLHDSPKTVAELLVAHRCICDQVLLRQVVLLPADDRPRSMTFNARSQDPCEDHENYRLEALFQAVFIVIDTLPPLNSCWTRSRHDIDFVADTEVLLVRTGEYHDLKTGPINFGPIESVSEEIDGNGDVRRVKLGDAVDFILELQRCNTDGYSSGEWTTALRDLDKDK